MPSRIPAAASFYSGDVRAQMETYEREFTPSPDLPEVVSGGIVPHAGWYYSGRTASKVYLSIKHRRSPRTFILFGAVHVPGVRSFAVYPDGAWQTPIGEIKIDHSLAGMLLEEIPDLLVSDPRAHTYEHSIEVQLPMIKYLFPDACILPIAAPPVEEAVELGGRIGRLIAGMDAAVIGSSDLTHYGDEYGFAPAGYGEEARRWMLENDMKIIRPALAMRTEDIIPEADANTNACGAGAITATVAAARSIGA
ncbi:MAG: AmmeMemoRadiSam system protein B, partial [Nitrospirota bacterium]